MTIQEQIRQQAKAYAFDNDGFGYDLNTCEDIFTDGAEWMQEQMMAKAQEFFDEDLFEEEIDEDGNYVCSAHANSIGEFFENFKNAMEE
jgi:hypothetical protein